VRRPALLAAAALVAPALLVAPQALAQTEPPPAPAPVAQPRAITAACPADQIQEDGFPDVAFSNVHESAVDCVVQWKVANGRTATSYGPGAPSTGRRWRPSSPACWSARAPPCRRRRATSSPTTPPAPTRPASTGLAEAGVVGGTGPGTYAPRSSVTRAQMAAFLARAYDYRAAQAGQVALPDGGNHFDDDETSPLQAEIDRQPRPASPAGTATAPTDRADWCCATRWAPSSPGPSTSSSSAAWRPCRPGHAR
jgi:hypothetical protein